MATMSSPLNHTGTQIPVQSLEISKDEIGCLRRFSEYPIIAQAKKTTRIMHKNDLGSGYFIIEYRMIQSTTPSHSNWS